MKISNLLAEVNLLKLLKNFSKFEVNFNLKIE